MYRCKRDDDNCNTTKQTTLDLKVMILPNGAMELSCDLPEELQSRVVDALYHLEDFFLNEGSRRLKIFMRRLSRSKEEERVPKIEEFCRCLAERSGIGVTAQVVH